MTQNVIDKKLLGLWVEPCDAKDDEMQKWVDWIVNGGKSPSL